MLRLYLSPAAVNAAGMRAPKYSDTLPPGTSQDWVDLGNEPTFLWAVDTDNADHAIIAASADLAKFPADLDSEVGGQLATVVAELESFNIPGDVVTAGTDYRTIARGIFSISIVMRRYSGIAQNELLFDAGIDLDRTLASIPARVRNNLQMACDQRGFSTEGLDGSSTIRQLFRKLATQPRTIVLLGVSI